MNRRTKIIVSVAGIFIILLALLGLTYAYFLTRINGNTNDKSISITTANLELTYQDGNGTITGTNIMPGTTLESKEFSVKNEGEDTSYVVVLEDVIIKDSSNNETTFESNDFVYTLTCTSNCNGATDEVLPISGGILVPNEIKKGVTQNYTLTVAYKETGIDQSKDMGKSLNAKVNIAEASRYNPYENNKNSIAYNIINNAILNKNGTDFRFTPLTMPAQEKSLDNERELTMASDDYGKSYYYRGAVEDNYLELNNICFRIVRIEGDGSIKLTLAKERLCSSIIADDTQSAIINNGSTNYVYGYTDDYLFNYEGYTGNDGLYTALNDWYTTNLKSVEGKLKNETWCLGGKTSKYDYVTGAKLDASTTISYYNYETGNRLWGPYDSRDSIFDRTKRSATYMCSSEADKVIGYIGSLTADEAVFAGGLVVNYKFNLDFEEIPKNKTYYLYDNAQTDYWTLSRSIFDDGIDAAFGVRSDGSVANGLVNRMYAVRPAVTIASGAEIASGDGTIGNPYTIKMD